MITKRMIAAFLARLAWPLLKKRIKLPTDFGRKEAVALVAAVVVTLAILVFQDEFSGLERLGYLGAFLAMLLTSATVVLPAGGLFVIFLLGGSLPNPVLLGVVAGLGSALGEFTGYLAGYSGHNALARTKLYQRMHARVERNALLTIFLLAVVPTPLFDLAGIAAGALRLPWWKFFFPTLLGKIIKTVLVALAGAYSLAWVEQLLR